MRVLLLPGWLACCAVTLPTARAQPADCPAEPRATASVPLSLDLNGLPGVPRGLAGYVGADIPVAPPGGTLCRAAPAPAVADVLRGEPGDVLRGPPARDLLGGPAARVDVGVLPDTATDGPDPRR